MPTRFDGLLDWRLKELAELRALVPEEGNPNFDCLCRATIVLCYSHWEGYYNDLTEELFSLSSEAELCRSAPTAAFKAVFLKAERSQITSRLANDDMLLAFLNRYQTVEASPGPLDLSILKARSNLNSNRLSIISSVYGLSWLAFEAERNFIDHQLCRNRHSIAHGDSPKLKKHQVLSHVERTEKLLEQLTEYFTAIAFHLVITVETDPIL